MLQHNPKCINQKILEAKHNLYQKLKTAKQAIDARILINAQLLCDVYHDACIANKQKEEDIVYGESLLEKIKRLSMIAQLLDRREVPKGLELSQKKFNIFLLGTHQRVGKDSLVRTLNTDVLGLIYKELLPNNTLIPKTLSQRFVDASAPQEIQLYAQTQSQQADKDNNTPTR